MDWNFIVTKIQDVLTFHQLAIVIYSIYF